MKTIYITFFLFLSHLTVNAQSTISRDVSQDDRRAAVAVKYKTKIITSYQGISMFDLADMGYNYFWGENGIQQNKKKGLDMLAYSAKKNCSEALVNLGDIYTDIESGMVNVNKGIEYYNKAIALGDIAAFTSLGLLYLENEVVPADYGKARYYFELGDKKGASASTYFLGIIYDNGLGVAKNEDYAISLYKKASADGMVLADIELEKKKKADDKKSSQVQHSSENLQSHEITTQASSNVLSNGKVRPYGTSDINWDLIQHGKIDEGMTEEEIILSIGEPDKKKKYKKLTKWIYKKRGVILYFTSKGIVLFTERYH